MQPYGPPCGSTISVQTIEQLYDKATGAVQMNGSIGEWFRTTVGVRQGCLLSPTLFNIFLEQIMSDALEEQNGKTSIGGTNITNLRFADDIDALAEEEQELEALVESLDKTSVGNRTGKSQSIIGRVKPIDYRLYNRISICRVKQHTKVP